MDNLNIRQFKLLNGEEIIAVLNVKNDDSYIIERPVTLVPNILGNLQFAHWFPLSSQKVFKLYKTRVLQHVPIEDYLHETYIDFVLNSPRPKYKLQTMREAVQELVSQEREHLEEEYLDLEPAPKVKETIH
jgi:hypothetical protein